MKIFVTGDNHFGKKYEKYGSMKERIIESRYKALTKAVLCAEMEKCDIFAVTGDLFDKNHGIAQKVVGKVVDILGEFSGPVLILPGNHDFYTGNEEFWEKVEDIISKKGSSNIVILNRFRPYAIDADETTAIFYPAFCDSKHSKNNNLGWIKETNIDTSAYNIGIAHGSIAGVSPDLKNEYFLMTEKELENIPVDAWLIGHTHIAYPDTLPCDSYAKVMNKVFNAGTHEQTDVANNTEGNCFILDLEKHGETCEISAKRVVTGIISYPKINISMENSKKTLEDTINSAVKDLDENCIVRLIIKGTVLKEDYQRRKAIYNDCLDKFISYDVKDDELGEKITKEKIRREYSETSFAAKFLEALMENPEEVQMAYELLSECKEDK